MKLDRIKAIADEIRAQWPEKAAELDRLIEQASAGKRDGVNLKVGIKYRLEKFEGDYQPGMKPFEVIEGEDRR
jgi:hypothetical protein